MLKNCKLRQLTDMLTCVVLFTAKAVSAADGETSATGTDYPELSLDSGLWRAEFLQREVEQDSKVDRIRSQTSAGIPDASNGTSDASTEISASKSPQYAVDPALAELPPVDVTAAVIAASKELASFDSATVSASSDATLSDWEQAVAVSAASKDAAFMKDGPSIISVVVGVVGLIVVVGACLTSGRSR